jgi:hypothetical protein
LFSLLLRLCFEAARASPPAAPAIAAPPATRGTFALLAIFPTLFIGLAPLLPATFGLGALDTFGFDDDLVLRFGADRFFGLVFV